MYATFMFDMADTILHQILHVQLSPSLYISDHKYLKKIAPVNLFEKKTENGTQSLYERLFPRAQSTSHYMILCLVSCQDPLSHESPRL